VGSGRGWLGVVVARQAAGLDGRWASTAGLSSWFQLIQVDEKFVHFLFVSFYCSVFSVVFISVVNMLFTAWFACVSVGGVYEAGRECA